MKKAMVLSGGGAYAAYEVGVMKALFLGASPATRGIPLVADIFTGTSAGSFNATMMVSQPSRDEAARVHNLETVWLNIIASTPANCGNGVFRFRGDVFRFLDQACFRPNPELPFAQFASDSAFLARDWFQRAVGFAVSTDSLIRRSLELIDLASFVSTDQFERTLEKVINLRDVRASHEELFIVATDFENGQAQVFTNGDMSDQWGRQMIMASSAIPGFFPPVEVNGRIYVDGGTLMNTPLKPAIAAGADEIHVVYLDPDLRNISVARLNSTFDVFERAMIVNMADTFSRDVEDICEINEGLLLLGEKKTDNVSDSQLKHFVRVARRIEERIAQEARYRPLTVHRYHPRADLGGALGLLDFSVASMQQLISTGFNDAAHHDCAESQCVLATGCSG